jgi:DNA-binding GntR family transcriptional regulator
LDAIEARDEELAELLMRRHISASRRNIESKLNQS